jgi:hypothetical protein
MPAPPNASNFPSPHRMRYGNLSSRYGPAENHNCPRGVLSRLPLAVRSHILLSNSRVCCGFPSANGGEDEEAEKAGSDDPVLRWVGGLGVRDGANASHVDACNQSGSKQRSQRRIRCRALCFAVVAGGDGRGPGASRAERHGTGNGRGAVEVGCSRIYSRLLNGLTY